MSFFKNHLPPTLHNAAGTLLASAVLAGFAGVVVCIKAFRDFPVPFWVVFVLFTTWVIFVLTLSKKLSKRHSDIQKKNEEVAALKTEIARLKDKIPIPRRPGESQVDYMMRIATTSDRD